MDPTATLTKILDSLTGEGTPGDLELDREAAIEGLHDLAAWLDKGGALPDLEKAIEDAGFELAVVDDED